MHLFLLYLNHALVFVPVGMDFVHSDHSAIPSHRNSARARDHRTTPAGTGNISGGVIVGDQTVYHSVQTDQSLTLPLPNPLANFLSIPY